MAQSPEEPFDVGQLATGLSNLLVAGVACKNWAIGLPEVAEASSLPVTLRNPAPEPGAGFCRAVSDHKCDDLSSSTAQSDPEPPFVRTFSDVCPAFVEFKDVILFSWPEAFGY
ncbi:hypothetical protein GGP50_002844 [Salinibacter ruber]|nr:hypothetical protein [Salinibacter ruber]MCS4194614.1 hypothetical protein [Salinibacter ruber]